jgi:hypothetical protein
MSARVHIASPAAVHLRQQVKAEVDLQIGKTIGLNLYNGVLGQHYIVKVSERRFRSTHVRA